MDFWGQVWRRVWEMTIFWSEIGSGFGDAGGTSPPKIPRSTHPGWLTSCKCWDEALKHNDRLEILQNVRRTKTKTLLVEWNIKPHRVRTAGKWKSFSPSEILSAVALIRISSFYYCTRIHYRSWSTRKPEMSRLGYRSEFKHKGSSHRFHLK